MQLIDFNKINYKRIDYQTTKENIELLTNKLKKSSNYNDFIRYFKEIIAIQNEIEEMYDYADIRNMRDSQDDFFNEEISIWNANKTLFDSLFNDFYKLVISSPFKEKLKSLVPGSFFLTIEYQLKIKSDNCSDLEEREKNLEKAYREVMQEKVFYNGEYVNISKLTSDFKSFDRDVRKRAHDIYNDFFYNHQEELDCIIVELINTRKAIATSLGFKDYPEYSLYKLRRFNYNYQDIKSFRENIIEFILPLARDIKAWQSEKLGLDELTYYDNIYFKDSPKLLYKGQDLLKQIGESFKSIDKELYELYNSMLLNNYIDLENRDNKVNFSITNYLCELGLPTITGNFHNNYLDVQITTHESGHAFQKYNASLADKNYIVSPLLKYPTMEIAEIFSHALEIISVPYLKNIFNEEDYKKYQFITIVKLIYQLPYICLVDEFQEKIYTIDNIDSDTIHSIWLELVKKYHQEEDNKGHINLDNGGYFYRQNHIYLSPFYYIDYALSSFGAIALANKCENNLDLFKQIAGVASYYPFKELIDKYDMPNPFDKSTVNAIANDLEIKIKKLLN